MKLKKINWRVLVLCILISFSAAIFGGIFTASSVDSWYADLEKPFFNPPSWVFSPVWTLLYFFMAVSLYLVFTAKKNRDRKIALVFFGIQLVFNALWSYLFFGLQNPAIAFGEIVLLLIAIVYTAIFSYRIRRSAGILFIPYILWVSFAAVLNYFIMVLN